MSAFESGAVTVRRDDTGLIHVGSQRPRGPLTEMIGLHGADLVVDVGSPRAVPYAVLDDVTRALWWLQFVYGEAVADQVRRLTDPDQPGVSATPPAAPGPLAAPVLRLAVGLWLWRWWPSRDRVGAALTAAGERWLMTELGTLAWYAEDVFGGTSVARSFLDHDVRTVIDLARRDPGTDRPLAVVRAVIESVPVDDATYGELARLEDGIVTSTRVVETADLDEELRSLSSSAAPVRSGQLTYRGSRSARGSGTSTVDWGRVRPRILGGAEDNVTWWTERSGLELNIRVPAGDRWEPGHRVYAAVYRNDEDESEAVVELVEDDRVLGGYVEIAPFRAPDSFRVVVFDDTDLTPGRPEPARTPAERDAVASRVRSLLGPLAPELAAAAPYALDPYTPWPIPGAT